MNKKKTIFFIFILLIVMLPCAIALEPTEEISEEERSEAVEVIEKVNAAQDKAADYLPEGNINNALVPGFQGGGYYLLNSGDMYFGGELLFDIFYGLQRAYKSTRSVERARNEVFISVGFYYSSRSTAEYFFHYLVGFNISFESSANIARNFLIPYMGLSIGGITIKDRGSAFVTVPTIGINIITMEAISLNVESGLLLSLVGFDEFLALKLSAALVIAL